MQHREPGLLAIERTGGNESDVFPYSVPAIRSLERLDLSASITFFVGENGSGKSTVLEAIAAAADLPAVGSADVREDRTLSAQRGMRKVFRLVWSRRNHRGFFLRAEDFFGFVKRVATMRGELQQRLTEIDEEFRDASPYARGLARGPTLASLGALSDAYGADLDARSHGESFLHLFQARFVPGGLHLLDEPEAALSPQSQLGLIAMLREMIDQGAQFIIATHSPLLLACPGARIYSFDTLPVTEVAYADLEHVNLMRDFLNDPHRYLRHLK